MPLDDFEDVRERKDASLNSYAGIASLVFGALHMVVLLIVAASVFILSKKFHWPDRSGYPGIVL